jgi:hypothetical protein
MRSNQAQQDKMGWSSPGLAGPTHSENLRGNVVDGLNSRRGWKRAYRKVGQNRQVDTEPTKGRVWRIATSGRRMGHSRRKTKRYWKSARGELKMGGRYVTRSLGAEDRRSVAAAVVATVDIESRMVGDHREAYCLELGCEIEEMKTLAGGIREQNCWRKGKDAGDPKTHDLRAHWL